MVFSFGAAVRNLVSRRYRRGGDKSETTSDRQRRKLRRNAGDSRLISPALRSEFNVLLRSSRSLRPDARLRANSFEFDRSCERPQPIRSFVAAIISVSFLLDSPLSAHLICWPIAQTHLPLAGGRDETERARRGNAIHIISFAIRIFGRFTSLRSRIDNRSLVVVLSSPGALAAARAGVCRCGFQRKAREREGER